MIDYSKIDLHLHTVISDGTDTPEELLANLEEAGIEFFSVTDHDSIKGSIVMPPLAVGRKIRFMSGVEFSCKDEEGKYHILGYNYDPEHEAIRSVVDMGHGYRMTKIRDRLSALKDQFNIEFPDSEIETLLAMDNPGKPHIGLLMVKYGYAVTKEVAIRDYINKIRIPSRYVRPEEAIEGILASGGIPVLAHPSYGSGDQLILGDEMDQRLRRLMEFGLKGVEGFYSGFTARLRGEIVGFADKYGLYVTAGSDYHGRNKLVEIGDTGAEPGVEIPDGMKRFMEAVGYNG